MGIVHPELNGHVPKVEAAAAAPARRMPPREIDARGGWDDKDEKPWFRIPESEHQYRDLAAELGQHMHKGAGWYRQGANVVAFDPDTSTLEHVSTEKSVTDIESVGMLYTLKEDKKGNIRKIPTTLLPATARVLLQADPLLDRIPKVRALSKCPVPLERDGELVAITGFDRESGILVHPNARPPEEVPFDSAMNYIGELLKDYRFTTEGDRARAISMILSPALMRSGLLGEGHCPQHVVEADHSQAGKGFLVLVQTAIYADVPVIISQRAGGVGSVVESLMSAIRSGHPFVSLDNWRGPFNVPFYEAALTAKSVECRTPYKGSANIDPRLISFSLTSNGAELTIDLANRSNIIRILKQPDGYQFHKWVEGGLLEHVSENQPWYLGAVWSIIREWHRRGCPLAEDDGTHDFRKWACAIRYILRDMLGLADPLEGYREIQKSKSTPALTWLRGLLHAVKQSRRDGFELRASDLYSVCVARGVEVPGLSAEDAQREDESTRTKALQGIGRKLASAFGTGSAVDVDGVKVRRIERPGEKGRTEKSYIFGDAPGVPVTQGLLESELPV